MLHGKKVILRSVKESDLECLLKWQQDPDLYKISNLLPPRAVTRENVKRWVEGYIDVKDRLLFAITTHDDALIGWATVGDIDSVHRRCMFGITIGNSDYWNRGYGADVRATLLQHLFFSLNLCKAWSYTAAWNQRNLHSNSQEKFGTVVEGRLRQHAFIDGQYRDVLILGILRDDFKRLFAEPGHWEQVAKASSGNHDETDE